MSNTHITLSGHGFEKDEVTVIDGSLWRITRVEDSITITVRNLRWYEKLWHRVKAAFLTMSHMRCHMMGGPCDGFVWVPNEIFIWQVTEYKHVSYAEMCNMDPKAYVPVEHSEYRRVTPRVFVHETELFRDQRSISIL